ncbi:hypothetical protein BDZ91DRAFT_781764 [Kalaharituber pfeilii]|nr:hypothetical protein BDZ91DRAFT_781764 [Kalaharituber pfeilii]
MTLESMIRKLLDAEGWAEVKVGDLYASLDTKLTGSQDSKYRLSAGDQKMLRKMIRGRIRGIEEQAGYLVAPWLKSSITEKAQSYAIQQAELVSVLGSGEEVLSVTIKWQEVIFHLSLEMENAIVTDSAAKFTEHIKHLHSTAIATAKRDFCDKGYTRFQVHYTALDGICDTSLRSKLAGDLVEYSQDLLLAQLEKLENLMKGTEMDISPFADFKAMLQVTQKAAKPEWSLEDFERKLTTFMEAVSIPLPTGEAIAFKKKEVVGDLKTQLQKTKDGPLALTITLILLHAEQGPGVLKASGKYVPKLLKILQAKVHKNTWDELVRIKHAVTSRTQLLEDDFSRLRQIAD